MSSVSMSSVNHRVAGLSAPRAADGSMLGASPVMQEVFRLIERVGPTEASVLLTGESGSGKELAARSIHDCSARRAGPFVAVNCGAIPAGLIEAEKSGRTIYYRLKLSVLEEALLGFAHTLGWEIKGPDPAAPRTTGTDDTWNSLKEEA